MLAAKPVCAIPAGDPWMENILRPIIESAGYDVVAAAEGRQADIVIVKAEDEVPSAASGDILRIRSNLDLAGANDDSIYRYDRAGLLSALGKRAQDRKDRS
jgi:two-component system chemotaxis sensor kinase CheA